MEAKKEMKIVQKYFSRGYNIGKLIPETEYHILQKQFELKSLDKDSKNYHKFRALSLGFDTSLRDRGLMNEKPKKSISSLQKLINSLPKSWEKNNDLEIDM